MNMASCIQEQTAASDQNLVRQFLYGTGCDALLAQAKTAKTKQIRLILWFDFLNIQKQNGSGT